MWQPDLALQLCISCRTHCLAWCCTRACTCRYPGGSRARAVTVRGDGSVSSSVCAAVLVKLIAPVLGSFAVVPTAAAAMHCKHAIIVVHMLCTVLLGLHSALLPLHTQLTGPALLRALQFPNGDLAVSVDADYTTAPPTYRMFAQFRVGGNVAAR
jgi:hypothetical protein